MTYLGKPKFHHPSIAVNALGFTHRDYEGSMSTLCAGCGHDAISAAIIHACFELSLPPHRVAKLSGIGCSSKTPTYMLGQSHGFNSVHGRMPSVLTGANLANRDLIYLGVSGDGDTASIGLGQFAHAMRRGVNMVYIVENNGVYGLTKGQFSATADRGSTSKKGAGALDQPIDLVGMAIGLGASFVGRSFSGDKAQLVPLIKAAFEHRGAAFIDVISPCVTFNNHAGSTKSFDYVREHNIAVNALDVIVGREPIEIDYEEGASQSVAMHDGSTIVLRKLDADHDLPRPVGGASHARARPRLPRDRHRPHLYQRRRRRAARHSRHDGDAAQRAHRARTLPRLEGARRDQRVAQVGRVTGARSRGLGRSALRQQFIDNAAEGRKFVWLAERRTGAIPRFNPVGPVSGGQRERDAARAQSVGERIAHVLAEGDVDNRRIQVHLGKFERRCEAVRRADHDMTQFR